MGSPFEQTLVLDGRFDFDGFRPTKVVCRDIESPLVVVSYEVWQSGRMLIAERAEDRVLRLDTDKRTFFDVPDGEVDPVLLQEAAGRISDIVDDTRTRFLLSADATLLGQPKEVHVVVHDLRDDPARPSDFHR